MDRVRGLFSAGHRRVMIVHNNAFVLEKRPPVAAVPGHTIRKALWKAIIMVRQDMAQRRALKSVPVAHKSQSLASFTTRLTAHQLEALRRCAKGISLRFEAWSIVNALVDGGYAENGVGGHVTVTAKGRAYVRMQEPKGMS